MLNNKYLIVPQPGTVSEESSQTTIFRNLCHIKPAFSSRFSRVTIHSKMSLLDRVSFVTTKAKMSFANRFPLL